MPVLVYVCVSLEDFIYLNKFHVCPPVVQVHAMLESVLAKNKNKNI